MSAPDPTELSAASAELLRRASELDGPAAARARAAFMRRVAADEARGSRRGGARWPVPQWAPALALALTLALVVGALRWSQRALTFEVAGVASSGDYIHTDAGGAAQLRFSDSTQLDLGPNSSLRVAALRSAGALVLVEQGVITAHVTHGGDSDWDFLAGPFRVHVTGTRFRMTWDDEAERLEVALYEGSVAVSGAPGAGPIALRAGQRLRAEVAPRRLLVTQLDESLEARGAAASREAASVRAGADAAEGAEDDDAVEGAEGDAGEARAQGAEEPAVVANAQPDAPRSQGSAHAAGGASGWRELVSTGQFEQVVAQARAGGLAECLRRCAASELAALADAARYTGDSRLAMDALQALRRRFPSTEGSRAAFLMGRLLETAGQPEPARRWYAVSLQEASGGPFAVEALAGKMRTLELTRGRDAARPAAREYLRRAPQGVHAAAARALLAR